MLEEEKIISVILKKPDLIDAVLQVPDVKQNGQLTERLYILKKYWKEYQQLPKIEVLKTTWPNLIENISDVDIDFLFCDIRKSQKKIFLESLYDDKENLELESIITSWDKNVSSAKKDGDFVIINSDQDVLNSIKLITTMSDSRISSGYSQFDEQLRPSQLGALQAGGFARGYSYLWSGLTGSGKTFILANFAVNQLMLGNKVLYITMEMSCSQINERILRAFYSGSNMTDIQEKMLTTHKGRLQNLYIQHEDNMSSTVIDIERKIKQKNIEPDIIIIDYLDNMLPSRKYTQSWEAQQIISADIARLAQRLNVPILTATQTNRGAANDKGTGTKEYQGYDTIGSSFAKTHQFAGIWAIISNDTDYDELTETKVVTFQCLKNREGKQFSTSYKLDYKTARLTEMNHMEFAGHAMKSKGVKTKVTKSKDEEQQETLRYFNDSFEKLKDDENYIEQVDELSHFKLTFYEKQRLKQQIKTFRIQNRLERRIGQ